MLYQASDFARELLFSLKKNTIHALIIASTFTNAHLRIEHMFESEMENSTIHHQYLKNKLCVY